MENTDIVRYVSISIELSFGDKTGSLTEFVGKVGIASIIQTETVKKNPSKNVMVIL